MNYRMQLQNMLQSFLTWLSNRTRWYNNVDPKNYSCIFCELVNVSYISSSNNIYKIPTGYFKECRKHNDFIEYLLEALDDFFQIVCRNDDEWGLYENLKFDIRNLMK